MRGLPPKAGAGTGELLRSRFWFAPGPKPNYKAAGVLPAINICTLAEAAHLSAKHRLEAKQHRMLNVMCCVYCSTTISRLPPCVTRCMLRCGLTWPPSRHVAACAVWRCCCGAVSTKSSQLAAGCLLGLQPCSAMFYSARLPALDCSVVAPNFSACCRCAGVQGADLLLGAPQLGQEDRAGGGG